MFFCIGENQVASRSTGKGQTVAEAIRNWSSACGWSDIVNEFNQYYPTVISGDEIQLEIEFSEPKITIHK